MITLPRYGKVSKEEAQIIFEETSSNGGTKPLFSENNEYIKEVLSKYKFDCESTEKQSIIMGLKSNKGMPFTTQSEIEVPEGVSRESVYEALVEFVELFSSDKHQEVKWNENKGLNFTLKHQPFFFQPEVPKNLKVQGAIVNIQPNYHLLVEEKYDNKKFSKQDHCSLYRIIYRKDKLIAVVNNIIPGVKANKYRGVGLKLAYMYDYLSREKNQLKSWMERAQRIENSKQNKIAPPTSKASTETQEKLEVKNIATAKRNFSHSAKNKTRILIHRKTKPKHRL